AVAVEVPLHQSNRARSDGEWDGVLKRAIAAPEGYRDLVRGRVDAGDIEPAVFIEVAGCQGDRPEPHAEAQRLRKGSIPRAEQDGYVVGEELGHRQIGFAVAVEV